mgnify:CR=1 FL=1
MIFGAHSTMLNRLISIASSPATRRYAVGIIAVLIFTVAAIIVYKRRVQPTLDPNYVPNKEFASGRVDQGPAVYFFYTTWCPHCKTAKPIWNEFKASLKEKKVNGQKVEFIEVDCDKDKALADRYNVKGYPTIKLVSGNEVVEYDAKPDLTSLHQFLKSSL